jgi:hypothetical protein
MQSGRQAGRQAGRKAGRKAGGQECRQTDRQRYSKTDVQIYVQTNRNKDVLTYTDIRKQIERQTDGAKYIQDGTQTISQMYR